MKTSINILNSERSEFYWSKIAVSSKYNIVLHCVYDPVNHFEEEYGFLNNPLFNENTLIILWHPIEEGPWWNQEWIGKLNAIVESAPYKLVYLTGCSHQLDLHKVIDLKFDVKFLPVFDCRSIDIWQTKLPFDANKNKKYTFINAKDTQHRRYVLGQLIENNLLDQGNVSYQCFEGLIDVTVKMGISHLEELLPSMDLCLPYLPIKIDDSNISTKLPRDVFMSCYINIVGETRFPNVMPYKTNFVTEKTFNAIANNQMFIVVGHAGSLELLKFLGYKTFDSIIDESYDTIQDNSKRLKAVTKEIIRYLSKPIEQIHEDYLKVRDIIEYNRDLLFSQSLESRIQSLIDQY